MQNMYQPDEARHAAEARMSFSGRLLTDRQFDDAMAITGIIERRIEETGTFKDCLNDFTNALARTERFDAMKADSIIRDLFKIRTGMTMNEKREGLMERETKLFDRKNNPAEAERQKAHQAALEAGKTVETGNKITFHRALNFESVQLAGELDVTHVAAKKLIQQSFEETENRPLREWGDELDEKHYRPQIEAEKKERAAEKKKSRSGSRSRSRQPSYS